MTKLVVSLADHATSAIDAAETVDAWWPRLEQKIDEIPAPEDAEQPIPGPSTDDLLNELLGITKGIVRRLDQAEVRRRPAWTFAKGDQELGQFFLSTNLESAEAEHAGDELLKLLRSRIAARGTPPANDDGDSNGVDTSRDEK